MTDMCEVKKCGHCLFSDICTEQKGGKICRGYASIIPDILDNEEMKKTEACKKEYRVAWFEYIEDFS